MNPYVVDPANQKERREASLVRNIQMEGYNEGADDWYRKAWDDVADVLEQAIEEKWPLQDLIDTLAADVRKYARRVVAAPENLEKP